MRAARDDHDDDVLRDVADDLFSWLVETYIQPEAKRRIDAGTLVVGDPIYRAQVLMLVDAPSVVRLNNEVQGTVTARAARDLEAGEEVTIADISDVLEYELPNADRDAARFTLFQLSKGWSLAFDGRYNGARVASHLAAADEYIATVRHALHNELLRAFAENAFAAAELLAKAELLPLPDKRLLTGRHGTVASNYNLWARLGNTEQAFAALLNDLSERRPDARYLRKDFRLDTEEARRVLATLEQMREHVEETSRGPDYGGGSRAGFSVIAHRDMRRGELVVAPPEGALDMLRPVADKERK